METSMHTLTKEEFKSIYKDNMAMSFGRVLEKASPIEQYIVLGNFVRAYATKNWMISKEDAAKKGEKQMYYFSMEFLMGRLLTNNLMNLGIYDVVKEGLADFNIDLDALEDLEADAGLGNGGLGRLAACFMDSIVSNNYIGNGNCIRYRYGFFKQKIDDKKQVEVPDLWLKLGNVWETKKPSNAVLVKFGGWIQQNYVNDHFEFEQKDATVVQAVPYDVPVVGYQTPLTNTLRLWDAQPVEEALVGHYSDYLKLIDDLTSCLYPNDSTEEGKRLRLKQQYFFVSAGIQTIINDHHNRNHYPLSELPDKVAIQLNDTHPVLVIPEMMRILMDDYGMEWDSAWDIVTRCCAYTNHTVLAEALEKWPVHYFEQILPRIWMIINEIQRRFVIELNHKYHRSDLINELSIIKEGQVHMANLAIVGSHAINGVAALHTQILKDSVFKGFYALWPEKFTNKTNGVTHRRWLMYSNPQLSKLLDDTIGDSWHKHPEDLVKFAQFADEPKVQQAFLEIKKTRKEILAQYIHNMVGIDVDTDSMFDVIAKRFHAYKRQLMYLLHIIYLIQRIYDDPNYDPGKHTFIFAGKAASSYVFAKECIELANCLMEVVNNDPRLSKYIKVVFIPNYGVSIAQILLNAADVSEQISTAGKEASGTSNMKFMMNGAITLGTLDGANIEIVNHAGIENEQIFGLTSEAVEQIKYDNSYNVQTLLQQDGTLRRVVDALVNRSIVDRQFTNIYNELLYKGDEYLVLKDFWSYADAKEQLTRRYQDKSGWAKACILNIANSGYFSSDRTIEEYVEDIWHLKRIEFRQ